VKKPLLILSLFLLLSFGCSAPGSSSTPLLDAARAAQEAAPQPPQETPEDEIVDEDLSESSETETESIDENVSSDFAIPIEWKMLSSDANFSINPPGLFNLKRNEASTKLTILPDFIGELPNTVIEWRIKIIKSTDLGYPIVLKLFTNSKKGVKVEHSINKTLFTGRQLSKIDIDLLDDFHTFKLVIDDSEKASLFVDGDNAFGLKDISKEIALYEPKGFYFEKTDSNVLIDYFYVDIENDGIWDYKEDWNDLNRVS